MKAKKALKRLTRVEELLSNVMEQYDGSEGDFRQLLDSAKTSVVRAKKSVNVKAPKAAKKPPVKAASSKSRVAAQARKKSSEIAKKQASAAA